MQRIFTLLGVMVLLSISLSLNAAILNDPEPMVIPPELTDKQVVTEIKRALVGRGWVVTDEKPGQLDASLSLRSHIARIAIEHGGDKLQIRYVSSENLKYKEKNGERHIHKNYLSWINNLSGDISRNFLSELQ